MINQPLCTNKFVVQEMFTQNKYNEHRAPVPPLKILVLLQEQSFFFFVKKSFFSQK